MSRCARSTVERSPRSRVPERQRQSEAGDARIEVLIAMVLLGVAAVALLLAFGTSISGSAEHTSLATFDSVLRSASEEAISQIEQMSPTQFQNCQTANAVSLTLPTPYTATVSEQTWNGTGFSA